MVLLAVFASVCDKGSVFFEFAAFADEQVISRHNVNVVSLYKFIES
jgi:hypothetical protein